MWIWLVASLMTDYREPVVLLNCKKPAQVLNNSLLKLCNVNLVQACYWKTGQFDFTLVLSNFEEALHHLAWHWFSDLHDNYWTSHDYLVQWPSKKLQSRWLTELREACLLLHHWFCSMLVNIRDNVWDDNRVVGKCPSSLPQKSQHILGWADHHVA